MLDSTVTESEFSVGYLFKELLAPLTGPSRPFSTAVGWLCPSVFEAQRVGFHYLQMTFAMLDYHTISAALSIVPFACSPGTNVHVSLAPCCHSRSNIQEAVVESFPSYEPLGDKHLTVDTAMPTPYLGTDILSRSKQNSRCCT